MCVLCPWVLLLSGHEHRTCQKNTFQIKKCVCMVGGNFCAFRNLFVLSIHSPPSSEWDIFVTLSFAHILHICFTLVRFHLVFLQLALRFWALYYVLCMHVRLCASVCPHIIISETHVCFLPDRYFVEASKFAARRSGTT